ncbi:MAG: T9SS type A sorting domain-containing protein [Bacteroidales bacterium]
MLRTRVLIIIGVLTFKASWAQYPPAAGQAGSTAVRNDSSIIVAWATHCEVVRGPMDISSPEGGLASFGTPESALGFAEGNPTGVVSLGDGGSATLTFDGLIYNGPGPDFVVFENGFSDNFLEIAFVEVSSNGEDFFRFPAVSLTDTTQQVGSFGTLDPTKLHNLAGKYRAGFGTPFDLEELRDIPGLDVNAISHVKIMDAIGCTQCPYATRDAQGHLINDPWPTPFPSSGFDLDGVGVIHLTSNGELKPEQTLLPHFDPVTRCLYIPSHQGTTHVEIFSVTGQKKALFKTNTDKIYLTDLQRGFYIIKLHSNPILQTLKIFVE